MGKVKMSECGGCSRCQMEDCGKCKFCKDKPKNGGRNKLRQMCEIRAQNAKCSAKYPRASKETPINVTPKASSSTEESTTNSGLGEFKEISPVVISPAAFKESSMGKANKKRSISLTKTTLAGETSKNSLTPRRRKTRCGKCSGCKKDNCGKCRN